MKNPAFGAFASDDEKSVGFDLADKGINVERDALRNLSRVKRRQQEFEYPFATKNFVVKTLADQSTVIIIHDDFKETNWKSPPPPCRKGDLVELLCDGHAPTCEPYQAISGSMEKAGYAPTGCKAYRKCSLNWEKKVQIKKAINRGK